MKRSRKSLTAYLQESKPARLAAAALLSFAGVLALPWMFLSGGSGLKYTNSIFSVVLFLALFRFLYQIFQTGFDGGGARWRLPVFFGTAFCVCMVFGAQLDLTESVAFSSIGMWISIFVLAAVFSIILRYLWDFLLSWRKAEEGWKGPDINEKEVKRKQRGGFLLTAFVILLCYIPVFLAVYPGFFVYDAQDEYLQVVTRNFTTHHPLVHVLFLGGIIQAVYKLTGSYNFGIALYTIVQMVFMAGIFAWFLEKMRERGMTKWCRVLFTLYFGLCPVLVMFALCSAKDGLFTGLLLIVVVFLQEMCKNPDYFFESRRTVILSGISSLGMMLLRHNGFYAFLVFIPVLMLFLRKYWKKLAVYFVVIVGGYVLIHTGLTAVLHADDSEHQEILTVPISQLARVYANEKEAVSLEDRETLYRYLPEEALSRYTPKVTDGVKIHFNNKAFAEDKGSFFRLWIKWGIAHPFTYLNAWFMTSYGFWYPDTVIDVYRGNTVFTYTYEDSSYFGYEVEQPGMRESRLPWLDECYRRMSLEIAQQKIPVVSMFFSPGFMFWVMAFMLGYLCYRKCQSRAVPFMLPALIWLTVILGPTYLVRYVVFLWVLFPLLLWEVLAKFDN